MFLLILWHEKFAAYVLLLLTELKFQYDAESGMILLACLLVYTCCSNLPLTTSAKAKGLYQKWGRNSRVMFVVSSKTETNPN